MNIDITEAELEEIKKLNNFDLIMFLSELNDFGVQKARDLLEIQLKAKAEGRL